MKKTPTTIKQAVAAKFDYFIERRHCRADNPKMQLKNMCATCQINSYHSETLKNVKKQVLDVLNNKSL